jgi:hypothetical protein
MSIHQQIERCGVLVCSNIRRPFSEPVCFCYESPVAGDSQKLGVR